MESLSLLDYHKENSKLDPVYLDLLKYEFDNRLYYYGKQFKNPFENKNRKLSSILYNYMKSGYTVFKIIQNIIKDNNNEFILSNAYFTVNKELSALGYKVYCPSWSLTKDGNIFPDIKLFSSSQKIKKVLYKNCFKDLITENFIKEIQEFEEELISVFQKRKIKAVILSNDMTFFEKLLINVSKKIGIPSFIFLHGLPGRYNIIDENRTDYLIVWGENIKKNYIKYGFDSNKIIVSGHPYYKVFNQKSLNFSLKNILVLTKSMNGGQHSDKVRLADRSNLILYLLSVEKVLRKSGVENVRLRPHPSEDINWYYQFISKEFFTPDNFHLEKSITDSSLIIGPTSTVFLESIYHGRNYLVYEPLVEGLDLFKFELIPPFDKSDSRVPVATNENELEYFIKNKIIVDPSCLNDYITSQFNLSFMKNLIK